MSQSTGPSGATAPVKRKRRRRTPAWIKAFGRNDTLRSFICWLVAAYIKLVYLTGRWRILGEEHPKPYWDQNQPFLLAFWHGRIMMMPHCWRTGMPMNMLISNHRDGAIISDAIQHFGLGSVRGSSSKDGDKGGARALRTMVKAVREGQAIGITPDGPAGPYMRASEGVCAAAKLAGVPIIPATFAARRRKVMKSWDRFVVALPFSRGVILWGEPILVDRKADADDLALCREKVEQAMIDLTREADLLMGVTPIVPPEETARD